MQLALEGAKRGMEKALAPSVRGQAGLAELCRVHWPSQHPKPPSMSREWMDGLVMTNFWELPNIWQIP